MIAPLRDFLVSEHPGWFVARAVLLVLVIFGPSWIHVEAGRRNEPEGRNAGIAGLDWTVQPCDAFELSALPRLTKE